MTELVGEAEGVASKVAVNVPVCEVMAEFCHAPPAVAVTHALDAVASVAEKRIDEEMTQARRRRNKRWRVIIGVDCGDELKHSRAVAGWANGWVVLKSLGQRMKIEVICIVKSLHYIPQDLWFLGLEIGPGRGSW